MALTLAWVEREIEECLNGDNSAKNVTDYAILCIARDNLRKLQKENNQEPKKQEAAPAQRIVLADHCADLNVVPKLEQIEDALETAAKVAYSEDDKRRVHDLRTWRDIIENG